MLASMQPTFHMLRQQLVCSRRTITAKKQPFRKLVLSGCHRLPESRHTTSSERPQRLETERFPARWRPPRVQQGIKPRVAGRSALITLARQQEVPVQIHVIFVETPNPSESKRADDIDAPSTLNTSSAILAPVQLVSMVNQFESKNHVSPVEFDMGALSIDDAHEVQRQVIAARVARGEAVKGYKVGCTSKAIRQQFGLSDPICGRLMAPHICHGDTTLDWNDYVDLAVEPEFVLGIGRCPMSPVRDQRVGPRMTRFWISISIRPCFASYCSSVLLS